MEALQTLLPHILVGGGILLVLSAFFFLFYAGKLLRTIESSSASIHKLELAVVRLEERIKKRNDKEDEE